MTDDGLWAFSLRFYDDAKVQHACLALQDDHGGDVNVALYLLWRAAAGEAISAEGVAAADAAVAPWRADVVRPLRALRRRLKAAAYLDDSAAQEAFRTKLKKVELDAEKLQQQVLATLAARVERCAPPAEAAKTNLSRYAAHLGAPLAEGVRATLAARLAEVGCW
jgi:uncharacterized protein (TIGR02444 family)